MNPAIAFGSKAYHITFAKVMSDFHGNCDLAHDAATETWLAAARKGPQAFTGEADFIGFVLFKAVKIALDLKRRRREITGCEPRTRDVASDAEGDRIRQQARLELENAMAMLPRLDREIIDLYHYEGFSDRAIAANLMGDSGSQDARRKAIQRRRRAAEQRLRRSLEGSGLDWDAAIAAFSSSNSNPRTSPPRPITFAPPRPRAPQVSRESNAA